MRDHGVDAELRARVAVHAERHGGDVGAEDRGREAVSGPDVAEGVGRERLGRELDALVEDEFGLQGSGAVSVLQSVALVQGDDRGLRD